MTIATLADIVREHGVHRGAQPALTFEGGTSTFGDLDARSSRVAQALAAEGVGAGDRVALLDRNGPEYFDLTFGAAKLGAVAVAVNWRLAPREVADVLADADARIVVVGTEFVPVVEKIERDLPAVRRFVATGEHARWPSWGRWLGSHPAEDPGVVSAAADVALQLYTSGTTGAPKGVMLTNENLFELLPGASRACGFGPETVNLGVMPLFHIAGSGWDLAVMFAGGHTVLHRDVDPAAILRDLPAHRVTHALFVPAVLQFLVGAPGIDEVDVSSLRTIVYGASPITDRILRRAMELFRCDFIQLYGLTETTGAVTLLDAADHDPDGRPELLRSCGRPMAGVELRIVDPQEERDVPDGEVGEVWIRTRQNMAGYWRKPEETAATLTREGWLRTGDAGYVRDGYLYLYDRTKDMVLSGGENVYPAEVENVLAAHPAVADVAVIGVPDDRWGETVKAIVVPAAGAEVRADELIAFAREQLAHYKCPTSVDVVDQLPRNPSGKLLKRELREPYWASRDRRIGG